jgi:hypothetical protein
MSYPAADAAKATFCLGGAPYVHSDGRTYQVALGKAGNLCKPVGLPAGRWFFTAGNKLVFAPFGTTTDGASVATAGEDLLANPWIWAVAVAGAAFLFLRR